MALEFLHVKEEDAVRVNHERLHDFITRLFASFALPENEAKMVADVLVYADLKGIDSHGVSNAIQMIYVPRLREGLINPQPKPSIVHETATTALVDGDGGMGMVPGHFAMNLAIQKAKEYGTAFVTVRNSRHFGAAGYYACMALPHDMIGWSMTNTGPIVLPTFGRQPMLGTNPIAVVAPTKEEPPFIMDFATSTVAFQKIAIAGIVGAPIPTGWAADQEGRPTTDPKVARESRALLPLGGTRESGSHKGYSLAVLVDVLCGVLSGAGYSAALDGQAGHFFGAMRIDAFRPADEFKAMMDEMIRALRNSEKAVGEERIYVAGEPDFETEQERRAHGIPLHKDVVAFLRRTAEEQKVAFTLTDPE
ncbi:MAG: Ldh family oxidoreductase [Chloroflexi bacterium]|nr:Ldh family oxidoreductase [Chloroflexota bacterium]